MRECGECSLCCRVMGVTEINKPEGVWCDQVSEDRSRGCLVYATRPETCRGMDCLWKAGALPEVLSPHRTRVVAVASETAVGPTILLYLTESSRAHKFNRAIDIWMGQNVPVILIYKNHRRMLAPSGMESQIRALVSGASHETHKGDLGVAQGPVLSGSGPPPTEEAGVLVRDEGFLPYTDD